MYILITNLKTIMAIPSTAATLHISSRRTPPYLPKTLLPTTTTTSLPSITKSISFGSKPRKIFIASSGDNPTDTTTTEAEAESQQSIEAPEVTPSLISALNVERALRGIAITDVDHYGRLGIPRNCPSEQVTVAYKDKVEELKKQGLEEEEFNKQMGLLKESYNILSSEEERRMYDWSLARSGNPDRYVWPFETDITQKPQGTPPPQAPEDVGPTRLVGYFMLGWVVLSFVLSIALNR